MAETKTTIPVEVKMGNAGTNDANLPAFKEGSIIFTKDTKKIYIDPIGETERIAVGGTEVDLNKKQDKFCNISAIQAGMNNYILKLSDFGFWDEEQNKYHTLDADNQRIISISANGNSFDFREDVRVKGLSLDKGNGAILSFKPTDTNNHFEISSSDNSNVIFDIFKNSSLTMNMPTTTTNIPGFILNCGIGFTVTAQNFQLYSPYGRIHVGDGKNGDARIIGVKDGVSDNDAVNVSQLNSKQGKFADITNPGICKVTMSNSGQTYFCNNSSDSGIYFDSSIRLLQGKGIKNDDDLVNKKYVDDETAKKQDKFAEYTSTRPSEEAPASASTNILVLNEGTEFYLRDRATNPLVEFKINNAGVLQGTTNNLSLTTKNTFNLKSNIFTLSNDNDDIFQVVMDDSKKVVYYGLKGGDDNGSLYLTNTSRTAQQGATLQGNVSSDARTTALVVNESNTKLLSWKQGTTTNNAPLLGVSTPVTTADTSKGITDNDLDYQAANKKYVDDIKTELLNAITHPYTYDETTKELTLIL